MKVDFKKLIFDMIRLSLIAILAGYVARGLLRGDWNIMRAVQIGSIIGISYPLFKVIMVNYGSNTKK